MYSHPVPIHCHYSTWRTFLWIIVNCVHAFYLHQIKQFLKADQILLSPYTITTWKTEPHMLQIFFKCLPNDHICCFLNVPRSLEQCICVLRTPDITVMVQKIPIWNRGVWTSLSIVLELLILSWKNHLCAFLLSSEFSSIFW